MPQRKIQYGHQAAILKITRQRFDRLLPIYTGIVLLKFGIDIQSQAKFTVRKPKNPIWPPGSHFDSGVAEINRLPSMTPSNKHMEFEIEIPKQAWPTLGKPYLYRQTDRRMGGQTGEQGESIIPSPTSLGGGLVTGQNSFYANSCVQNFQELVYPATAFVHKLSITTGYCSVK